MGDVIHHNFGNRINWNDYTDSVVREASPAETASPGFSADPRLSLKTQLSQAYTMMEMLLDSNKKKDVLLSRYNVLVNTLKEELQKKTKEIADIHRTWEEALEFQEASPAETNLVVRPIKQDIHDQVSTTMDTPPPA